MALGNGGLGSNGVLNTIIHPEMLASLARFYPAVATIEESTQTRRPNGEIVDEWTAVSNLTGLRGIFAGKAAAEKRGAALTVATATHVLDLQGYYPAIVVTNRVTAVSGSVTAAYNVVAVKHDSQSGQTRLELELVNH